MKHSANVSGRPKFIGNIAAFSALASAGMGAVLSPCSLKTRYVAPVFPDQAPDGPALKAGLVDCAAQVDGIRPPLGALVDVGDRRMHLHCTGSGSPVVVLEAGASSFALD